MMRPDKWELKIYYKNQEKPAHTSYFAEGTQTVHINLNLLEPDAVKFELTKVVEGNEEARS